jgi:hypothetical protein
MSYEFSRSAASFSNIGPRPQEHIEPKNCLNTNCTYTCHNFNPCCSHVLELLPFAAGLSHPMLRRFVDFRGRATRLLFHSRFFSALVVGAGSNVVDRFHRVKAVPAAGFKGACLVS